MANPISCNSFMCKPKNSFVDENSWAKLIVNRDEVSRYHLLVYPKEHSKNFSDLPKEHWEKGIIPLLKEAVRLLSKNNEIKGFSINHNAGTDATEPHTHFHIVPKYRNGKGFSCNIKGENASDWGNTNYHFFGNENHNICSNFDDIFDSWIKNNYFDGIQNLIKTKSIKNFNLFARVGEVDGGSHWYSHLHFIPKENNYRWIETRSKRRPLSDSEMREITQEIKNENWKNSSVPNPNKPTNPDEGGKNTNDIADTKFLQDVVKLANYYSDVDLGEYALFNKKILDLYHDKKFAEIEIYRNKMIKYIVEKKSTSSSPAEVDKLKKKIWEKFESDSALFKTQVDELKKILVIKNDEPTDNSNKNNDTSNPKKNSPPNDNQPNPNKLDSSPLELPTIDTKKITNAENIETAQLSAKQQIQALFTKSKIKPSDLDKSLWDNKENWETYLQGLTTNQAIVAFSQLLERKIKEKQQSIKDKNNVNSPTKPNSVNKALIFSLGGGAILLVFAGLLIIKIRHRRRKK